MLNIILTIGTIQVLAIFVNILRSKIIAVLLGPEGMGVISIIDQVVQFAAQLSVLSLPFSAVKFLSYSHSEGYEVFRKTYSNFLKMLLILTSLGTVVTIGLVLFRIELFAPDLLRYKYFLLIALMGIPTVALGGFFYQVLASAQRVKTSIMSTLITNIILTFTTYLGISQGGLLGLYIGNFLAGIIITLGIFIYLRSALNLSFERQSGSVLEELRRYPDIIPFSIMLYCTTLTYSFSFLVVRYAVLKYFGEAEAGLLQSAMAPAIALGLVLNPTNGLYLTPIMNRNIEKEEKIRIATEFQKKLIIILGIVAMPVILFPKLLLILFYSPLFTGASKYVFLFVLWESLKEMAGVHQSLIIGFDDLKIYSIITCGSYLLLCLCLWFIIPYYGIIGAAMAFIIANLSLFLMTFIRLRLKHGFYIPLNLALLMVYTISTLFLVGNISQRYEDWQIGLVGIKVGIYLFFVLSLLFFLNKEEKNTLSGLWNRFRIREI